MRNNYSKLKNETKRNHFFPQSQTKSLLSEPLNTELFELHVFTSSGPNKSLILHFLSVKASGKK